MDPATGETHLKEEEAKNRFSFERYIRMLIDQPDMSEGAVKNPEARDKWGKVDFRIKFTISLQKKPE